MKIRAVEIEKIIVENGEVVLLVTFSPMGQLPDELGLLIQGATEGDLTFDMTLVSHEPVYMTVEK